MSASEAVELGLGGVGGEPRKSKAKAKAKIKVKTRVKRTRSRVSSSSDDRAPSLQKVASVIFALVRLSLELFVSLCRGADRRRVAASNLAKYLKACAQSARREPVAALKMSVWAVVLCLVLVAGLSALGLDVSPVGVSGLGADPGGGRLRLFIFQSSEVQEPPPVAPAGGEATEDDEDGIPMPSTAAKKRMTKKLEIKFACDEVACLETCSTKVTKKCKESEGCMRQRLTYCKKKCRKQRCEERCKNEPQIGYVEREMKLDKCKEDCQANGSPQKCVDKCEKTFQTCKSKCSERRKKFVCDRQPDIPFPGQASAIVAAASEDDDAGEASESFGGSSGESADAGVEDEEI